MILFMDTAGASLPTEPSPTFSNVSLLIHGSARPFIDVSTNKRAVENYLGRVSLVGSVASFTGTTAALRSPASAAFDFGTGAWAINAKIKFTLSAGTGRIFDTRTNSIGATNGIVFSIQQTTGYPIVAIGGVTYGVGTPAANLAVATDTTTDVAMSYDGTVLRCFVGGLLSWSHTVALNVASGSTATIGNVPEINGGIVQEVSELQVVKGETLLTTSYIPLTTRADTGIVLESGAAPTFSNVKLLLHCNGTNGSTTVTDSSASARTVSVFGNAQISTARSVFGGASLLLDGSGDYCTIPNSADFNFSGDFGIEYFAWAVTNTAQKVVLSNYQNSSSGWTEQIVLNTGRMCFNATGDGLDVSTGENATTTGAWIHHASFRVGSLLCKAIGGEIVQFVSDASSISSSVALHLGRFPGFTEYWNGNFDEVRIVKGESPYARSFIVQTAAHPDS